MVEKFYMSFIFDDRYLYFVKGFETTMIQTLGSFLFGILLAFGLCALKRSKRKAVRGIVNAVCGFFVQIPSMVLLMIFVYIIFGGSGLNIIITVVIALAIKAAAFLSEIFYTAIETVSVGEIEAARALGMSKRKTFFHVVFPQALTTALPLFKNQFISTLQETSIVGYLAIMDLTRASSIITSRTLDAFFGLICVSIMYLIIGYAGRSLLGLLGRRKHIGG